MKKTKTNAVKMILHLTNFTGGIVVHRYAPELAAFATNQLTLHFVATIGLGFFTHWLYDWVKERKPARARIGAKRVTTNRTRVHRSASSSQSSTKNSL